MLRRILCMAVAAILCVCLCGCAFYAVDTDELLSPPELTGDMLPIRKALDEGIPAGYTLKYPSSGDRRSAVVLEDINNDNRFEAFAFYSANDDELTNMHLCLVVFDGKKWKMTDDRSIVAGGVDKVDFCDLDGDGIKEVLIGWEIYGSSDKQLVVYSVADKKLTQKMMEPYTSFICCDIDDNGENEIFVQHLSTADQTNNAYLFSLGENGGSQVAGCLMDRSVKSVNEPILSTLSSGQSAIYIDEVKGIGAITEVLFWRKGELINQLLDSETTNENIRTLRGSMLMTTDINNDEILEIPVASELPSATSDNEIVSYTNWCSFNGDTLTVQLVTVVNTVDGYYLSVPDKWIGKIAITKDTAGRVRTVYSFDPLTKTAGVKLATFKAVVEKEYQEGSYKNAVELSRANGFVYIAEANDKSSPLAVTQTDIQKMFCLFK